MIKWLKDLGHSLTGLYGLLPGAWTKLIEFKNHTLSLFTDIQKLISDVEAVIQDIKTFEVNPKWNTRVIVAPRVVERIQELYDVPIRITNDIKDLVKLLREKVQPTEFKVEDVEELDGVPAKLAKAGEKILGFVTLIVDALVSIEAMVADLEDIVDAIKTTLEDLKGLDALFLPQGSTKKTVDKHYRSRIKS